MQKYDVYSLGNALVDIEFEVSANTLQQLDIEPEVMTLIDANKHQQLLSHVEGVKHEKACGGSAANTVIALTQLGGKGFYSCKIANDDFGHFYLEDIHRNGLDTNLNKSDLPDGTTGKCIAMITPDAKRSMNTYLGISDTLSIAELSTDAIANSQYVYFEGYSVTSEHTHAAALKARDIAKQHQVKISLSLSDPNMAKFFAPKLHEIIGDGIDLIFCNEEEAYIFTQTRDLDEACAILKTKAKAFAITRGAQGSIVFDGQQYHDVATTQVKTVDTLGAGDMYAGAFLYALTHHGYNYLQAAKLANFMATQIVTCFGPRLTQEKVTALLREHDNTKRQAS
ncbi:MAG: adenosine kinase [Gammaproteobacteria bacterium]